MDEQRRNNIRPRKSIGTSEEARTRKKQMESKRKAKGQAKGQAKKQG